MLIMNIRRAAKGLTRNVIRAFSPACVRLFVEILVFALPKRLRSQSIASSRPFQRIIEPLRMCSREIRTFLNACNELTSEDVEK